MKNIFAAQAAIEMCRRLVDRYEELFTEVDEMKPVMDFLEEQASRACLTALVNPDLTNFVMANYWSAWYLKWARGFSGKVDEIEAFRERIEKARKTVELYL